MSRFALAHFLSSAWRLPFDADGGMGERADVTPET